MHQTFLGGVYSKKATKFWEISTVDMTVTALDKSTVEISQKFVAFSEYMNFTNSQSLIQNLLTNQKWYCYFIYLLFFWWLENLDLLIWNLIKPWWRGICS